MTRRTDVLGVLGGLGVLLASSCLTARDGASNRPDARSGPVREVSRSGAVLIEARDQQPIDARIVIDAVSLRATGYLAVYEDAGGAPGRVVGSTGLLSPGRHEDVAVTLRESSTRSTAAWLMLHREDDDVVQDVDPTFDVPGGDPPIEADNGVAVVRIALLANAEERRA